MKTFRFDNSNPSVQDNYAVHCRSSSWVQTHYTFVASTLYMLHVLKINTLAELEMMCQDVHY